MDGHTEPAVHALWRYQLQEKLEEQKRFSLPAVRCEI